MTSSFSAAPGGPSLRVPQPHAASFRALPWQHTHPTAASDSGHSPLGDLANEEEVVLHRAVAPHDLVGRALWHQQGLLHIPEEVDGGREVLEQILLVLLKHVCG